MVENPRFQQILFQYNYLGSKKKWNYQEIISFWKNVYLSPHSVTVFSFPINKCTKHVYT